MKKLLLILILLVILLSCSDKKEIAKDNVSEQKNIESIVIAKTPTLSKGNELFLNGKYDEAIKYFEQGLQENKAAAFYNMGVSFFLLENYEESKKYFQMAYDLDNTFKEAYINLAASLIQLEKLDEAEKIIKELENDTDSTKLLINAANIYLKTGNTAKAYYYLDKASKVASDTQFYKSSYGAYLLSIGEYSKSIQTIEGIKNKGYTDYFNLALNYYNLDDHNKSILNAKNALEIKNTVEAYDILAKNFEAINDYILAAETYRNLLKLTDDIGYKHKYAHALYKGGDYNRAIGILNAIIKDYPTDKASYLLKYKIYDELGDTENSTKTISDAFKNIKDNEVTYKYVWHYLVRLEKIDFAKKIIFNNNFDNNLKNLLMGLYYLKINNLNNAKTYLDKVNNIKTKDYYHLLTYYYMKSKNYEMALNTLTNMDEDTPEKLWYEFIANWNMKNQSKVIGLSEKFLDNLRIFKKKPKVSITISPVLNDFDLSFPFNGSFEDILRLSLTPIIINPDEMLDFIALGYKLLQEKESKKALEELKKSVKFATAIDENNKGFKAFIDYDFLSALKHFKNAEGNLKNNSIILYNIGLTYLNLGEKQLAFDYFDRATIFNRFTLQAYLGKAILLKIDGDITRSSNQYGLLLTNYDIMLANAEKLLPYFEFSKYYAQIGLGRYDIVLDDLITAENKVEFYNYMINLASYFKNKDTKYLDKIKGLNTFRNKEIYSLLKILKTNDYSVKIQSNDISYNTMLANIHATYGQKYKFALLENAPSLKEEIYRNILFKDYQSAFRQLQVFSRKYFKNFDLYKTSMYYFMAIDDKTNAEASMTALEKLGKKDIYTEYYKILYFLKYFNEKRLIKQVNSFIESYPYDFRGIAANAILSFRNSNFKNLRNDIINMSTIEPEFLKKLPVEIEIEDL
ncbi:tetratricopeptide repeat protein [Deferribacteraceae bacterium V6Fe1]|nr:tetratricopeptide repeat protein [Deferribacteraceae bacterium V6Fe1]